MSTRALRTVVCGACALLACTGAWAQAARPGSGVATASSNT